MVPVFLRFNINNSIEWNKKPLHCKWRKKITKLIHFSVFLISRKKLCLEQETKKDFTLNKRQRKALPWTTMIWWRLFNLLRLIIIANINTMILSYLFFNSFGYYLKFFYIFVTIPYSSFILSVKFVISLLQ